MAAQTHFSGVLEIFGGSIGVYWAAFEKNL
jgi:hypothetical protein